MTRLASTGRSGTADRRFGPAVGEPPPAVDPRRWGSLIGVAGGIVFVASYSPALGTIVSVAAWTVGVALALTAIYGHYVRPVALGQLTRPRPLALIVYAGCVVGELALIAIGSRLLTSAGHGDVRPALIAAVVGVHFIPFAWAFGERLFLRLGVSLALLGAIGLVAGVSGIGHAAEALAVAAGLVMLTMIAAYARGVFSPKRAEQPGQAGRDAHS
jgi:hypothetical protein